MASLANAHCIANPLAADLEHILSHTRELWKELRGQRLFITGGTGFFGCWLLESIAWANDRLGLDVSALVLTRDPSAFQQRAPHLASHPTIQFHVGDIRSFAFPAGHFSHVLHAATEASAKLNDEDPLLMFETITQGTRRVLDFSLHCRAEKVLLTSSGAVYGKQPSGMARISEDYLGAPDVTSARSAYGEGKRVAEILCALYARQHRLEAKIARCFAFVGPYMPLDRHFAIGNFVRDALQGETIHVSGDGTPYRSYLYAADLVIWLWHILIQGESCRPYNVGSEQEIAISSLAEMVAKAVDPEPVVQVAHDAATRVPPERYVPSVRRASVELGLEQTVALAEALRKTLSWHRTYGRQ